MCADACGADAADAPRRLWVACARGDTAGVREVLRVTGEREELLEWRGDTGTDRTPLAVAAHGGRADVVRALLTAGSNANAPDADTLWTPCHHACAGGHARAVAVLVGHARTNLHARTAVRATPLHIAARGAHAAAVRVLVCAGADPTAQDTHGWTPMHWAAHCGDVDTLTALGNDAMHMADKDGWTPVHVAASAGQARALAALAHGGACLHTQDALGWTPLHHAAHRGHTAAVRALLHAGARAWARDTCGNTPLHASCERGERAAACVLVAHMGLSGEFYSLAHLWRSSPHGAMHRGGSWGAWEAALAEAAMAAMVRTASCGSHALCALLSPHTA